MSAGISNERNTDAPSQGIRGGTSPHWGLQLFKATILTASSLGLGWLASRLWLGNSSSTNDALNNKAMTVYGKNDNQQIMSRVAFPTDRPSFGIGSNQPSQFESMGITFRGSANREPALQQDRSPQQNLFQYIDSKLTFPVAAAAELDLEPAQGEFLHPSQSQELRSNEKRSLQESEKMSTTPSYYLTAFGNNGWGSISAPSWVGFNTISPTKAGEVVVSGAGQRQDASWYIFMGKLDKDGQFTWYQEKSDISFISGYLTEDGFLCGGSFDKVNGYWIAKFDLDGKLMSTTQLRGTSDPISSLTQISPSIDGGGWLTGTIQVPLDTYQKALLCKLDSQGNVIAARSFFPDRTAQFCNLHPMKGFSGQEVKVLRSGKLILLARCPPPGSGGPTFLVKLDINQKIEWSKALTNYPGRCTLIESRDGNLIIAGKGGNFTNFYVSKINMIDGSAMWTRSIGDDQSSWSVCHAYEDVDGGIVLIGNLEEQPMYIHVTKLNRSGYVQWARKIGGGKGDYCVNGAPSADGGMLITGSTSSFKPDPKTPSASLIIKLDANGTIPNGCTYIREIYPVAQSISTMIIDYPLVSETPKLSAGAASLNINPIKSSQTTICSSNSTPPSPPSPTSPPSPPVPNHLLEIIIGSVAGGTLLTIGIGVGGYYSVKKCRQADYEAIQS